MALGTAIGFDGFQWRDLAMLLYIPLLALGYGANSTIMDWVGVEWLVRALYAFLLSLPLVFYGLKRWVAALVLLEIAFQIQAGSLGHISWFGDFLVEDIVRYGTLGALIVFNVLKPTKTKRG